VALRVAAEMSIALRYNKLQMFGVPLQGPSNIFCDNESVVKNAGRPESPLVKKHNYMNYKLVREAVAKDVCTVLKKDGQTNLVDLFTKELANLKQTGYGGQIMRTDCVKRS
jgi:hypothetical protein